MASLAQGIVAGNMPWGLLVIGIFFGLALLFTGAKAPMLIAVGMYLPFGTTAAMFVGGLIRWTADRVALRRGFNEAQMARVENAGVLTASGLIAGEAILGLVWAGLQFAPPSVRQHLQLFANPSYLIGLAVLAVLAVIIVRGPLHAAGSPDEPAPPVAMM